LGWAYSDDNLKVDQGGKIGVVSRWGQKKSGGQEIGRNTWGIGESWCNGRGGGQGAGVARKIRGKSKKMGGTGEGRGKRLAQRRSLSRKKGAGPGNNLVSMGACRYALRMR